MADTYSKLLGLSDAKPQSSEPERLKAKQTAGDKPPANSLLVNQQTSKLPKKQTSKEVKPLPSPATDQQKHVDSSLLTTKEKTKYGTYLTDEMIEKISIRAIQTKRDSHQIVQEALNQYFERLKK